MKNWLLQKFLKTRQRTLELVASLATEDLVVQTSDEVSPIKWHLAHTTWFWEQFVLLPQKGYIPFQNAYLQFFNSYYDSISSDLVAKQTRGSFSRPTVQEILDYREYVDKQMQGYLYTLDSDDGLSQLRPIIELGINHEQQHQELILMDILHIMNHNQSVYGISSTKNFCYYQLLNPQNDTQQANFSRIDRDSIEIPFDSSQYWLKVPEGNYTIGFDGTDFCFDNEAPRHRVWLHDFEIQQRLVTNGEYLEFINENGYQRPEFWLADGWQFNLKNHIKAPMYWHNKDQNSHNEWEIYNLLGRNKLLLNAPVAHISFYEADAFARWNGCRLPTEYEWEIAIQQIGPTASDAKNRIMADNPNNWLYELWNWTSSPYIPYPHNSRNNPNSLQTIFKGVGEYNAKFMSNQMVLRGGCFATPSEHLRITYRNFFYPYQRWLFSGIRLAR